MHEALGVAFSDCLPPRDCTVTVEPRMLTDDEMTDDTSRAAFSHVVIARTLSVWTALDGSVAVQIASPSSNGVAIPASLCLGDLLTVSVAFPDQLHAKAVANTLQSAEELSRYELNLKVPCLKCLMILH